MFKPHHALSLTTARALARCGGRGVPYRRYLSAFPHPYKFNVGASWAGKQTTDDRKQAVDFPKDSEITKWRNQTLNIKKGNGRSPGEDFFYVQEMRNQSGLSVGVADGVGGWVDLGVDPSLFSQALMYHAHRYSKDSWAGEPEVDPTQDYEDREQVEGWELTPQQCMGLAHGGVLRERIVEAGSSTACILHLNASSGKLRAANLGDSGFSIIRSNLAIYNQPPQVHFFNCPKQLAKVPTSQQKYDGAFVDWADMSDTYEARLMHGDIVIAYTDGLSDNVFPSELAQICSLVRRAGVPEDKQAQVMADRIVQYAQTCMTNHKRVSPFEKAAARAGKYFRGGKVDDVTVVLVTVHETL